MPDSTETRNRCLRFEHRLCRKGPERNNEARLDQFELFHQEWLTRCNFVRLWITIFRGSAFHDIGNVHILTPHLHPLGDDFCEELAGSANKGFSLEIFVSPRRLTN